MAQITEEIENDPNPLPPITARLVFFYLLLPATAVVLLLKLLRRRLLKRHRNRRMSKLRRIRHFKK